MRVSIAFAVLLTSFAAAAQEPPPPQDAPADELLVEGERPGPSLWRIHDQDSEIYVLATVPYLPRGFQWNDHAVEAIVKRSKEVLTEARIEAGAGDRTRLAFAMVRTLTFNRDRLYMPKDETLETRVGPELAAAFTHARAQAQAQIAARKAKEKAKTKGSDGNAEKDGDGAAEEEGDANDASTSVAAKDEQKKEKPDRLYPFLQSGELTGEAARGAGLARFEPINHRIERLARQAHVPTRPLFERDLVYRDLKKLLVSIKGFKPETDKACVADAVDFAENKLPRVAVLSEAWAVGDVAALRASAEAPRLSPCLEKVSAELGDLATLGGVSLSEFAGSDVLADGLQATLKKPGVRLAVLSSDGLLSKGGVFDVLRARGIEIDEPKQPEPVSAAPTAP